jgi:hypothetical protein
MKTAWGQTFSSLGIRTNNKPALNFYGCPSDSRKLLPGPGAFNDFTFLLFQLSFDKIAEREMRGIEKQPLPFI